MSGHLGGGFIAGLGIGLIVAALAPLQGTGAWVSGLFLLLCGISLAWRFPPKLQTASTSEPSKPTEESPQN
jgi:hypothetical protein